MNNEFNNQDNNDVQHANINDNNRINSDLNFVKENNQNFQYTTSEFQNSNTIQYTSINSNNGLNYNQNVDKTIGQSFQQPMNQKFNKLPQQNNQSSNTYHMMENFRESGQQININSPYTTNNVYQQNNIKPVKKKKFKWSIPFWCFIGFFVFLILSTIVLWISKDYKFISKIFQLLSFLSGMAVLPAFIIAVVIYCNDSPEDKRNIVNMINGEKDIDNKLLIGYIGNKYEKIIRKKFSVSAFFLSSIYLIYRKQYLPAIAISIVASIADFISPVIYYIIYVIFIIVLGINFNKWYVEYAKKQINKIKANNPNASVNQLIDICRKKGGTNVWGVVVWFVVLVIISSILPSKDVNSGIWGLNFSIPSNYIKQDEKIAYFAYEVEYDAGTWQYCSFKLSAQNNASLIEATSGLHSPDNYIYKDYSAIEEKNINSNIWYYQSKKENLYDSYFYSTKYNDIHYLIEFKVGNNNTQCYDEYIKIISSLKFK